MNHAANTPLRQLIDALDGEVHALRDADLFRRLWTIEDVRGASIRVAGKWATCFCSNDYLGLSTHPRVIQAACQAAATWGIGGRASRLLAGTTALHEQLEARLAAWFGAESAIVYSSGYLTNLGTLQALLSDQDLAFVDRRAHASLIEACRASRARLLVFRHNDAEHLGRLLCRYADGRRRVVITEGVFSMDGDAAPLQALREVVGAHGALLYLDDAHGVFATGATGRGSPEAAGVDHGAMLYMGTLGKALGCQGGFVLGSRILIEALRHRAKSFIYTTAMATPVVGAAIEALALLDEDAEPRRALARNVCYVFGRLQASGFLAGLPERHIVPIHVGAAKRACELAEQLWERGVFAPAIRPPTVPHGAARLRLSVTAAHTEEQLDHLATTLASLWPQPPDVRAS